MLLSTRSRGDTSERQGLVFAELNDTDAMEDVVFLARCAHEESRFAHITFAPQKVRAIAERALGDPRRHAVMMAWKSGKPVGAVNCSVGEYQIGVGTLITTIHNIFVLRDVRQNLQGGRVALGLLRGVETWSQARSSKEVLVHATSGIDMSRTHKLIKRLGYRFIGGNYAKEFI